MNQALKDVLISLLKSWDWGLGDELDFETPNPNRDFFLKFTCLKWNKYQREWELTCLIDGIGTEKIYDPNVEYSETMSVLLTSWKNNRDDFYFYYARDLEKHEVILSSLFDDFKESFFTGQCYTR